MVDAKNITKYLEASFNKSFVLDCAKNKKYEIKVGDWRGKNKDGTHDGKDVANFLNNGFGRFRPSSPVKTIVNKVLEEETLSTISQSYTGKEFGAFASNLASEIITKILETKLKRDDKYSMKNNVSMDYVMSHIQAKNPRSQARKELPDLIEGEGWLEDAIKTAAKKTPGKERATKQTTTSAAAPKDKSGLSEDEKGSYTPTPSPNISPENSKTR